MRTHTVKRHILIIYAFSHAVSTALRPSMPAAPHFDGNLFNGLKFLYPDGVFRVVTRLDKDTSGLVLVAKNALAHSVLFEEVRFIEKTYTALVEGELSPIVIDAPIVSDGSAARRVGEGGKPAITRIIDAKPRGDASLLTIVTETGRTHQIRVHLSHVGHPLVGDVLYGARQGGGQLLCCTGIGFIHPVTRQKMEFFIDGEAEIDQRRQKIMKKSEKNL